MVGQANMQDRQTTGEKNHCLSWRRCAKNRNSVLAWVGSLVQLFQKGDNLVGLGGEIVFRNRKKRPTIENNNDRKSSLTGNSFPFRKGGENMIIYHPISYLLSMNGWADLRSTEVSLEVLCSVVLEKIFGVGVYRAPMFG